MQCNRFSSYLLGRVLYELVGECEDPSSEEATMSSGHQFSATRDEQGLNATGLQQGLNTTKASARPEHNQGFSKA